MGYRRRRPRMPSKERVREVISEVEELDLSDGAHWQMIADILGLKDGSDVMAIVAEDPEFFEFEEEA